MGIYQFKESLQSQYNFGHLPVVNYYFDILKFLLIGKVDASIKETIRYYKSDDIGKIMKQMNSGEFFTCEQKEELKRHLLAFIENWKLDISSYNSDNIHTYSKEFLTQKISAKTLSFIQ
jgi:hypothetical protein